MGFAVKWPLSLGASFWPDDGLREENVCVCNGGDALCLTLANLAIKLIAAYQKYLRPVMPVGCRFDPGCSEYTKQAILKYGFIKGVFKGLIRISHCHPFSGKSGYDPLI